MKTKIVLSLILLIVFTVSCQKDNELQLTLYVEHTGSIGICKDFRIIADGQEKLSKQLCSSGVTPNVTTITFTILSGKHTIKAEVVQDSEIFEQEIDFNDTNKFAYLTYNNNTLEFNLFLNSTGGID